MLGLTAVIAGPVSSTPGCECGRDDGADRNHRQGAQWKTGQKHGVEWVVLHCRHRVWYCVRWRNGVGQRDMSAKVVPARND